MNNANIEDVKNVFIYKVFMYNAFLYCNNFNSLKNYIEKYMHIINNYIIEINSKKEIIDLELKKFKEILLKESKYSEINLKSLNLSEYDNFRFASSEIDKPVLDIKTYDSANISSLEFKICVIDLKTLKSQLEIELIFIDKINNIDFDLYKDLMNEFIDDVIKIDEPIIIYFDNIIGNSKSKISYDYIVKKINNVEELDKKISYIEFYLKQAKVLDLSYEAFIKRYEAYIDFSYDNIDEDYCINLKKDYNYCNSIISRLKNDLKYFNKNNQSNQNTSQSIEKIFFADSLEKLEKLFEELSNINKVSKSSKDLIKYHFFTINSDTNNSENECIEKIQWLGYNTELIYLFFELDKENKFDSDFYTKIYVNILNHFVDRNNQPFNNEKLAKLKQNMKDTYPKIDKIIKKIF